ncbi:MAG: metalloregulator ArsR/SmtB family transcription factor [Candidatus Thermoplasmatota archaeon]|nr:metalloregulator ArsR/SmtB family transcription factor [Candidatus Thermoplasmatota archaeon]
MKIPEEVQCELDAKGGIEALAANVPDAKTLKSQAKFFGALSDEKRLRILALLNVQPLCVCVIKQVVKLPDSKLSYHLSVLKNAGLVKSKEKKNWLIYEITGSGRQIFG